MAAPIHLVDQSWSKDIHVLCLDTWTWPMWDQPGPRRRSVWFTEEGDLYTFTTRLVTCPACLERMEEE